MNVYFSSNLSKKNNEKFTPGQKAKKPKIIFLALEIKQRTLFQILGQTPDRYHQGGYFYLS